MLHAELIAIAEKLEPVYQPAPDTIVQIEQVDLTLLLGVSGAGKDTTRRGTGLPVVVSDTTRPPRTNEGIPEINGVDYHFRGDEPQAVVEDLERGRFVQFALFGDTAKNVYGTRAAAYPTTGPALLDVVLSQIDVMSALPFRSVAAAYIVPPSFSTWQARWEKRGHVSPEDTKQRMHGSLGSLVASRERDDLIYIVNDDPAIAAAALSRFATEREVDPVSSRHGKNVARRIMADLRRAL